MDTPLLKILYQGHNRILYKFRVTVNVIIKFTTFGDKSKGTFFLNFKMVKEKQSQRGRDFRVVSVL